jgi:hypothetical protein
MAIDPSASSLGSVTQFGWQQLKLQQAKRSADQAEQTAQMLQQQASVAKQEADRAQENARALGVQSDQARYVIDQAVQRQSTTQSTPARQDKFSSSASTQTSTTGTIINTTA